MARVVFDTNILIDYLRGVAGARSEIAYHQGRAISLVTWMEVLAGVPSGAEAETRAFLEQFDLIDIDAAVAEQAVELRRSCQIKLPDAIIWASALVSGRILVTRDLRAFPKGDPRIRIPYSM
ncbi:MAG TPA: type II toxin-antitoxin system VapC family toxin [Allosphingosinicella sp.]|nr:type II toxin-antitoxin system VapC family toxin [Allosphingosinicella sp.]